MNIPGGAIKNSTLLALLVSAVPVVAPAETITGGLTLSYSQHSNDFGDLSTTGLDGRLAVDMDNGLSFGIDLGHGTMSPDGAPFDINAEFYSIDAAYRFGNGIRAGVFADRLTLGVDGFPIDLTLKTNGVKLGYEGTGFEVEAFVGKTSLSIAIPVDIENLGVSGHYTEVEGLDVGATFLRSRLSNGGFSEDIDFKGAAATYMVSDSLMVFGGVGQLDLLGIGDIDSMGLGAHADHAADVLAELAGAAHGVDHFAQKIVVGQSVHRFIGTAQAIGTLESADLGGEDSLELVIDLA